MCWEMIVNYRGCGESVVVDRGRCKRPFHLPEMANSQSCLDKLLRRKDCRKQYHQSSDAVCGKCQLEAGRTLEQIIVEAEIEAGFWRESQKEEQMRRHRQENNLRYNFRCGHCRRYGRSPGVLERDRFFGLCCYAGIGEYNCLYGTTLSRCQMEALLGPSKTPGASRDVPLTDEELLEISGSSRPDELTNTSGRNNGSTLTTPQPMAAEQAPHDPTGIDWSQWERNSRTGHAVYPPPRSPPPYSPLPPTPLEAPSRPRTDRRPQISSSRMDTDYLTPEGSQDFVPPKRRNAIQTLTAPTAARDPDGIPLNANRNSRQQDRRRQRLSSAWRETQTPISPTREEAAPRSHYHESSGLIPISSAENQKALRGIFCGLTERGVIDSSVMVEEEAVSRNLTLYGPTRVQASHQPDPERTRGNHSSGMGTPEPTPQRTETYETLGRINQISSRMPTPDSKRQLRPRSRLSAPFSAPEFAEEESSPVSPLSTPVRRQVSILSDVSETNEHWDSVLNRRGSRRQGQLKSMASRLDERIDETMEYWERT